MYSIQRYHDISCGHRVVGHEGKCAHLHGHNYRIHFDCTAGCLDVVGRVLDFGIVKERLCTWLEVNWDHKFLVWDDDEQLVYLNDEYPELLSDSLVFVPFNPTAENIAQYLVNVVGPKQLAGTRVRLCSCKVEETYKCAATYTLPAVLT